MSVTNQSAIRVRGLVKRYGAVTAVSGLDLDVKVGECFGLLGPNGAGKTTTVEILEGLLDPTSGEVTILDKQWNTHERELRERIGISLQETKLNERLTVRETLELFQSFFAQGRNVDETLALVSLGDKQHAWYKTLSGGQKQRLAVACALVGNPDLLFLDEPTTGLDPQSRRQLWDVISTFKSQGRTVLLTTHYMDEAEKLCDRIAIVDYGKVIAQGTPSELIASLGAEEALEFNTTDEVPLAELRSLTGVKSAKFQAGSYSLTVDHMHIAVPAVLALLDTRKCGIRSLTTHRLTLEDVFLHLTGRALRE